MMNTDTGMAEAIREESDLADIKQLGFDRTSCQSPVDNRFG